METNPKADYSVTLVVLVIIMVVGLLIGLTSFLSYLTSSAGQGSVKDYPNAQEETHVEKVFQREFQAPVRPETKSGTRDQQVAPFF